MSDGVGSLMCIREEESYDYDSPLLLLLGTCRVQAKYHTMAGGGAFGNFSSIDIVSLALMELPLRFGGAISGGTPHFDLSSILQTFY